MKRHAIALSLVIILTSIGLHVSAQSCDVAPPVPITPLDGLNDVPSLVQFSWSGVPDAVEYRVVIQKGDDRPSVLATTTRESIARILSPGSYVWAVVAVLRDCVIESARSSFIIQQSSDCAQKPAPMTVSPGTNAVLSSTEVTFTWQRAAGAVAHTVWLVPEAGFPTRLGSTTTANELAARVPFGRYRWLVEATFSGCDPVRSTPSAFAVSLPEECLNRRQPIILSPTRGAAVTSPVAIAWSRVPDAVEYRVYTVSQTDAVELRATLTGNRFELPVVGRGSVRWLVEAVFAICPPERSSVSLFRLVDEVPCRTPDRSVISGPRRAISGQPYMIRWTPSPQPGSTYALLESTDPQFEDQSQITVHQLQVPFFETSHQIDSRGAFHYSVRTTNSCDQEGAFSRPHRVVVGSPQNLTDASELDQSTAVEQVGLISQTVMLSRPDETVDTYSISTDVPWLTVSPSSGSIGNEPVAITLVSDGAVLELGSNRASLRTEFSSTGKSASQTTTTTTPISVTLVTPVTPGGGTEPSPDTLIIPAVAHADGLDSQWQSDIRVANTSAQALDFDFRFTESGTDGTSTGDTSSLSIVAGQTLSLDDILESVYGEGALGESAVGALEVRPVSGSSGLATVRTPTVVTSRTYNTTPSGTFGQFIPAALYADFVGAETARSAISLQHVAQSDAFRTNVGLVEASGKTTTVAFTVYDGEGTILGQFETALQPREHRQLNQVLAAEGISLQDGRIEVEVLSGEGRISAYASVVDNLTGDPRIVAPAYLPVSEGGRFIVPGIADLDTGTAAWRTDIRVFNAGTEPVDGILRFFPQGAPDSPSDVGFTALGGETLALDNILAEEFGLTSTGGVIHVIPNEPSPLVVTARTFNQTVAGTFGQFIPSVTEATSAGLGDPALQLLQIEQSEQFRTNLGLTETDGNDVRVRITAVVPGSKTAPAVEIDLRGNEFTQLVGVLQQLGLSTAYNARITVEVISGDGRVSAYASVIDNETQDPTYVPAQ